MDQTTQDEFETLFETTDRITVDPRALERKFTMPERNRAMVREFRDCFASQRDAGTGPWRRRSPPGLRRASAGRPPRAGAGGLRE